MSLRSSRPKLGDTKCCVVSSYTRRHTRSHPQPWIVRKLCVPLTFGIMGYTAYVYIARLCLPMVEQKSSALGIKRTGIILLVFFGILLLWMIWAYFKVILTPPGYARDHISKTVRPPPSDFSGDAYFNRGRASDSNFDSIEEQFNDKPVQTNKRDSDDDNDLTTGPPYEPTTHNDGPSRTFQEKETTEDITTAQFSMSSDKSTSPIAVPSRKVLKSKSKRDSKRAKEETRLSQANVIRRPSSTPILRDVYRFCDYDELLKPYRTHHCRICGTCVLKFDHHCPWIGQCVGARNHKFFWNFCFATSIYSAYVFGTVLFFFIRSLGRWGGDYFDPQFIVLLALAALFCLFTTSLAVSHVMLITQGQTTVESMKLKDLRETEERKLAIEFSLWECSRKRKMRRAFDEEWGTMNTEANMWWKGSAYAEWVDVMGEHWLGWIFPIGRGLNDGLSYPVNPRFDSDGRLRKRIEWPVNLR